MRIHRRLAPAAALLAAAALAGPTLAQVAPDSADGVRPLLVGAEAPDVTLHKPDGGAVKLREALDGKPAVVVFYRGGW